LKAITHQFTFLPLWIAISCTSSVYELHFRRIATCTILLIFISERCISVADRIGRKLLTRAHSAFPIRNEHAKSKMLGWQVN